MAHGALFSGMRFIELDWDGAWKNIRVSVDGAQVAGPLGEKDVRVGHDITLDDGTKLSVKLAPWWGILHLHVTHDGHFLGATSGQASQYAAGAAIALALNAVLVLLQEWRTHGIEATLALGFVLLLAGAAFFTWRAIPAAAWTGSIVATLDFALRWVGTRQFPGIFWVFLLLVVFRGIPATLEFAHQRRAERLRIRSVSANPYQPPGA